MSTINVGIQGSNASYSIDVDQMRDRLGKMHQYLSKEIEARGGEAPELAKRLNKIESQMARLDRLDGKDVEITAQRAMKELGRGMDLLKEGADYLSKHSNTDGPAAQKMQNWFDHLHGVYRQIDTEG